MNARWKCHFYPSAYDTAGTTVRISIRFGVGFRQMAAVRPDLHRRQSITELVGVRESQIILMALCVTPTFLWLHLRDLCPRTQPFPRRVMWD